MRVKTCGVVAAFLVVLSGCSGGSPEKERPEIATLRTAAPSAPVPAPPERPLIRPDEGREEFDRYVAVYDKCLREHGAKDVSGGKAKWASDAQREAATGACGHLYPELWIERQRRTNPEFADLLRTEAACIKAKGHEVKVGGDPLSLVYADNNSANRAYEAERDCERQAFAATG